MAEGAGVYVAAGALGVVVVYVWDVGQVRHTYVYSQRIDN